MRRLLQSFHGGVIRGGNPRLPAKNPLPRAGGWPRTATEPPSRRRPRSDGAAWWLVPSDAIDRSDSSAGHEQSRHPGSGRVRGLERVSWPRPGVLGASATESDPHGGAPVRPRGIAARSPIASSYRELAAPCADAHGLHPADRILWRRLLGGAYLGPQTPPGAVIDHGRRSPNSRPSTRRSATSGRGRGSKTLPLEDLGAVQRQRDDDLAPSVDVIGDADPAAVITRDPRRDREPEAHAVDPVRLARPVDVRVADVR